MKSFFGAESVKEFKSDQIQQATEVQSVVGHLRGLTKGEGVLWRSKAKLYSKNFLQRFPDLKL